MVFYPRWPDDLIVPFVPRRGALVAPGVAFDSAPTTCLTLNQAWASHVLGVLDVLTQDDLWAGDDATRYAATQEAEKIMQAVALGNCEESSMALERIIIADRKPNNTNGGTFTSGAWQVRTLNTILEDTTGLCTLSGDNTAFFPPLGVWGVTIYAPASQLVARHMSRLAGNFSGAVWSPVAYGTSMNASDANHSIIESIINADGSVGYRVEHRCQTTVAGNGWGVASNFGVDETYTLVKLEKLRDTL